MVVFDMAGTTVQDDGGIALAFQQAMGAWGYSVPLEEINPLMGYQKPEAIRMMLQVYEPNEDRITTGLIQKIHRHFEEAMLAHYGTMPIAPLPGAEDLFLLLKEKGIAVVLNTGFSKAIAGVIIARLGWLQDGLVDDVIASDEVPAGRPQPHMIRELMRRAGIEDAEQVVKVGDTEVDVREGFAAGCRYSVAITTGAFSREELELHKPSFIIDHLSELPAILEPAPLAV